MKIHAHVGVRYVTTYVTLPCSLTLFIFLMYNRKRHGNKHVHKRIKSKNRINLKLILGYVIINN